MFTVRTPAKTPSTLTDFLLRFPHSPRPTKHRDSTST